MIKKIALAFAILGTCFLLWLNQRPAEVGSDTSVRLSTPVVSAVRPFVSPASQREKRPEADFGDWAKPSADKHLPDQAKLDAFQDWTKRWENASPAERAALAAEGERLAAARRPEFKALIATDPRRALEMSVPRVVRQDLPKEIVAQLEKPVSATGDYNVYMGRPAPGQPIPEEGLTLRYFEVEGKSYQARVYGEMVPVMSRKAIPLRGVALDREFAVAESPVRQLEVGERIPAGVTVENFCPVSGLETAAVSTGETVAEETPTIEVGERFITLCNGSHVSVLDEKYRVLVQASGPGGAGFFMDNFPGTSSEAIGNFRCLYIRVTYPDQMTQPNTEDQALSDMKDVARYYRESSYGKLSVTSTVTPLIVLPQTLAWYVAKDAEVDGLGVIHNQARNEARKLGYDSTQYNCIIVRVNGGLRSGSSWGGGDSVWAGWDGMDVLNHECGHSIGRSHANYWNTTDGTAYGTGANQEYGNPFDVMGGSGGFSAHYNTISKRALNWLPASYVHSLQLNGVYRIYAYDQPTLEEGKRYAITVAKDSVRQYNIEYHPARGGSLDKSALVLYSGMGSNSGHLLDTTPGSLAGKSDAGIAVGRTFSDFEADMHFTVLSKNNTTPPSLDVAYQRGPFPGNVPPTATFNASAATVNPGDSVTFTATANDANGDPLAYHWEFSDGVAGDGSSVFTRVFVLPSQVTASLTVSDMKGGSVRRSTVINVGAHGKQTITGTITLGGQPLPGVYVSGGGLGTYTNVDGTYSLAGVSTGSLTLSSALPGHTINPGFTNPLTVVAGTNTANWTATASPFVTLASIADANEGGANGTFRLTRTGDTSAALTVLVSPVGGTATKTTDYTFTPDYTASGSFYSFTIPAGSASRDIVVAAVDDASAEGPETITLQLASATGYFSGSANSVVMTINDNDTSLPMIAVTAPDPYAAEGGSDTGAFLFTRTGSTASPLNLTVTWTGTATNGTDYSTLSTTVTIPATQSSYTLTVSPLNDSAAEVPETVIATISSGAAYVRNTAATTATVTLTDDDTPYVSVSVLDSSASEAGPDSGVFLITRTGPTAAALKVYYGISGGALHGTDYAMLSGEVMIPAGSASAPVVILPIDDDIGEQPETVTIAVTTFDNSYSVGSDFQASLTISDNGDLPLVSVRAGTTGVEGSSSATLVFRAIGTTAGNVTVNYTLSGTATAGADYTAPSGTVTIPSNGTNDVTVTIPVTDDAIAESTEAIRVQITSSPNYRVYNDGWAEAVIRDNDSGSERVSVSAYNDSPAEASSVQGRFYFSRTGSASLDVSYVVSGTATNGTDYNLLSGTINIPATIAGMNLAFVPVDDAILEGAESVTVTVVAGPGYSPDRPSSATLYIADNETSASTLSFQSTGSATGEAPGVLGEYRDIAVTLSPASASTVSVSYTSGGGTAQGDDVDWTFADAANGNAAIPGGTLTFAPGETSKNIRVRVKNDLVREPTEYATLRLVNPINATLTSRYQHNLFIYDELPANLVTEERWNNTAVYTNNTWNTVGADYTGFLNGFTPAQDVADNYSRRLTGLVTAPTTGSYTFWIASDDASKLFISTDATAANKVQRATLATWTTFQNWTANSSQQSVALTLTAGQSYYVEVQHQEGGGGDHVSVAWQGPGFSRTPILNALPDNAPRYVRFAIDDTTRLETDVTEPLLFAVLDRPAGATAVTVNYSSSGTATPGTDYTLTPGTLTFNPGEQFKSVPLTLLTDALGEAPESIIVSLSSPVGASLSAPSSHLITLVDPAMPVVGTVFTSANSGQPVGTVIATMTATVTSPRVVSSWSIVAGNPNNAFAINGSGQVTLALPGSLPNPGNIQLVIRATDDLGSSGDGAANIVCNAAANQFVSEQRWSGSTAYNGEDWSATPSYSGTLATLTSAQGVGDSYSRRLTGYLKPAVTGTYYFWTASDDQSRLYLGTDGYESSKVLIASVGDWTAFQGWDEEPNQLSVGIPLVAGQTYWIEAQHLEGSGGDHVSIAWQGPGISRQPIPSSVMGAFVGGAPVGEPGPQAAVPVVSITSPSNNASFFSTNNITVTADVTPNGRTIDAVEFYRDNVLIGTDGASPYAATYLNAATAASVNLTARALYLDTFATSPSVNIVVVNANPPTVATKYFAATSGMAVNTVLGTATASVFAGRTVSSWSIVSGNTGNLFAINNSGQVSLLLPGSLPVSEMVYLTVRATDSSGYSGDGTVGLFCNSVGSSVWVNANGGSWPTTANWSNGTAVSGNSSTADFAVLDLTANAAVTLDGARTVGNLVFGDSTPSHNWTLSTGSAGPLTLNTTTGNPVVTVNNQTATLNLVLAGTKGLIKNGNGTLALGGVNTFTGGLTVNAGTVSLQPGDYNNALPNNSVVTINSGGTVVHANTNVANNTGVSFTVNAGGTLSLTSYHCHLKGLTLNGGLVSGTGSGKYNGEDFALDATTVTVGGSSASAITLANTMAIGATHTFTVADSTASSAADLTFGGAGSIKGTGSLVKAGAGTMALGLNSAYTGTTTVSAGTLLATNASGSATGTGAVTVATAGSLGGTGTITGAVTVNGGLVPGVNAIGTLTATGTVTLVGTSTSTFQIAKTGAVLTSDKLLGVTTLTYGGTLTVTASGDTLAPGDSFTLFGAAAYAGSFSTVSLPALGSGLQWNTSQLSVNGSLSVASGLPSQTITFNPLAAKVFGDSSFGLTATASSNLPVSYASSDTNVATISGSTLTIVGAGSATITASQAGNGSYQAATPVDQVLTVSQASQTITFNPLGAKTFGDGSFSPGATVNSPLTVSYSSSNTAVATVSGGTVTIVGAGSSTITASQAGNTNYAAATSVPQVLNVAQAPQTITFNTLPAKTYGDPAFTLGATTTSPLTISYTSSDTSVATISGNTVTLVGSGSANITASQAGNTNYLAAISVVQPLTVNPPAFSTLYLDVNGATAGSGTPGAAAWDSGTNWTTDTAGTTATQAWLNVPNVVFSAGTEAAGTWTVTIGGTVSTNSLTFNGTANTVHTITGGTISSGAGGLAINATAAGGATNRDKTIASAITGTGGVTIAANGDTSDTGGGSSSEVTLSGVNTFTGGVTITAGMVNTASNFGDSANVVTLNGGGLVGLATSTLTRDIVAGPSGGFLRTYGAATLTHTGVLSGSGTLRRTDGGTFIAAGANTFSGILNNQVGTFAVTGTNTGAATYNITAGTLNLGNTGASGSLAASSTVNIVNSGTLRLARSDDTLFSALTPAPSFSTSASRLEVALPTQAATLTLDSDIGADPALGIIRFSGGATTLASGTDLVSDSFALGLQGSTNVGIVNITPGSTVTARYFNLGDASSNSGLINQSGGSVTLLSGNLGFRLGHWPNNTNPGSQYNLTGGTLDATALSANAGTARMVNIGWDGLGTMVVGGGAGTATLKAYGIQLDANGDSAALSDTLTIFANGVVEVGAGNVASASSSDALILSGGLLRATATNTVSAATTVSAASTLEVGSGFTTTHSGVVSGSGSLAKSGAGILVLSGANTFTGGASVTAGTLRPGSSTGLGTGAVTVTGGTFDLNSQTLANTATIGASGTLSGVGSLGATALNGTLTPGGSASGLVTLASATVGSTASLQFQLAGTGTRGTAYDALTVNAALALDGTVTVTLNGLTPALGQSFDLINSTGSINVAGFSIATDLVLPSLSAALAWDTSAFASTGVISIVSGVPSFTANPIAASATEDSAFSGQLSATDASVNETLTFTKQSGASWLTVSSTGALSGTPLNGNVGVNAFTVRVTDSAGQFAEATLNVTVANTNDAPTFAANPINLSATEDSAFTGQLSASDVDVGDTLTFAKVSGPSWLSVSTSGALSGTPTNSEVGLNTFTVSVKDAANVTVTATLNIMVANTNDAPVFAADPINLNATEDSAFTGQLSASDVDVGDTLTFAKVSGPSWLSVSTSGALSGTPTNSEVGLNTFTVSVKDAANVTVTATLNITVANTNDAPVFTADPINLNATEDSAFTGQLSASDVDVGDTLTFAKVSGPSWLSVSTTGALGGTPTNPEVGPNTFTVSVSDGTATVQATLNVTVANTNDAPTFAANPISASATGGSAFTGQLSASDADVGDVLSFSKQSGPSWLSVSPTGSLSGTPSNADAGLNAFTVAVGDGTVTVTATLTVTVTASGPSFSAFTSARFSPAEQADPLISGPNADPDKDGVSNLLEYAFSMDPRVPSVANLPQTITVPVSADTFVGVTYTRLKGATDLVFTSEFSSVPESAGFTASGFVQISLVDNLDGTETVTLRDTTPVTPATPRFVRLRVEQN